MPPRDATDEIISRLDLAAEFDSYGVVFTGPAKENGWAECYAMSRDEENPSAAANLKTGRYRDLGGSDDLSFWDFVVKYGRGKFKEFWKARKYYAEKTGVSLAGGEAGKSGESSEPKESIEWRPWNSGLISFFCSRKKGVTDRALLAAGAQIARHQNSTVVSLPIFGASTNTNCGWCLMNINGNPLYKRNKKGEPPTPIKTKLPAGSSQGLLGKHGLEHLSTAEIVWHCEGPPDLLSLWSIIPDDLRDRHVCYSPSNGANQRPAKALIEQFRGKDVRLIPDADTAGVEGAEAWAEAMLPIAKSVKVINLGYPVAEKHGKDLRDWINEGRSYDDLLDLEILAPIFVPKEKPAGEKVSRSRRQNDDSPSTPPASSANADQKSGFSNYTTTGSEETKETHPKPMRVLVDEIHDRAGDWPCKVDGMLFVVDESGEEIRWLKSQSSLFSWMHTGVGHVDWPDRQGFVSKQEFFEELVFMSKKYDAVESLPHEPPIPGIFYLDSKATGGDGEAFESLLDRFSPETEADRELIRALFMTVFWGGKAGSRPVFVITADSGRGAGKSKLTDMLAELAGGMLDLSQSEDPRAMRERLLSPGAHGKRIIRLDNVKTHRLSWADLESLVTSPSISGRRMYHGEGSRPNHLTIVITLNGPSLSTDMAQRSVLVKLCKPEYVGDWETETIQYIQENRDAIIGDILAHLRKPTAGKLINRMRWAHWEREIVGRLNNFQEVQNLIAARSKEADTEIDEIGTFEEFVSARLGEIGYSAEADKVHIPSDILCKWWNACMRDNKSPISVSKIIGQFATEGSTTRFEKNSSRNYGRGFVWNPCLPQTANYNIKEHFETFGKDKNQGDRFW